MDVSGYLALLGEPVHLLETCTSDASFEDAVVLLRVDIEWLLVERLVLLLVYLGRGLFERGLVGLEEGIVVEVVCSITDV